MKRMIPLSLVFLCGTALADPAEDVRCREIGFSKSVEASDHQKFASFIDDDARFVGGSVLRGSASVAEAWSVFFQEDGPRIMWRPQIVEVLEDGGLALSRGPYRMTVNGEDGQETEHWGTFNSVWRKQPDGEWKIVFDAGGEGSGPLPDEIRAFLGQEDACAP